MAKTSYAKIADIAAKAISEEKLRISFEYIDWESRFISNEQKDQKA